MSSGIPEFCRNQGMVTRFRDILLVLGALFALVAGLAAIDSAFRHPSDEQLALEDQALDAQIRDTVLQLQKLHSLKSFQSMHMAPQQANVKWSANGECLEVLAHSQNHEMPRVKSAPIDYKVQSIAVCYANDKLSRIESVFTTVSQTKKEKDTNSLVHRDPVSASPNEIILTGSFNEMKKQNLRVGDLQNSYEKPMRISFKKDYYLPHLRQTTYILQRTYDMHRREAIRANTKTVNQYLNYTER
jgi:hypothetical protein